MKRCNPAPALIPALLFLFALFAPPVRSESCLWRVAATNGGILYLQGSVHVLKAEHYPLDPAIEAAYAESDMLVLEVDMAEMMSAETQQLLLAKGMLEAPKTLKEVLDPETYAKLSKACTDAGLPIMAVERFKPWFATLTLAMVKMQSLGLNPQNGLDTYFFGKAKTDGKPVVGLESVDFQINLFDELAKENPNDFVNRSLNDMELFITEIDQMLDDWKNGRIEEVGNLLSESFDGYPGLYDKFITARNIAWSKKLTEMLGEKKTTLVVVGAGHLPGEKGLLNLLKQQGLSIEQL